MKRVAALHFVENARPTVARVLTRVLEVQKDKAYPFDIEIRSQRAGLALSRREHQLSLHPLGTPPTTSVDRVLHAIAQQLEESPGDDFAGILRIRFTANDLVYGSFTREIKAPFVPPKPSPAVIAADLAPWVEHLASCPFCLLAVWNASDDNKKRHRMCRVGAELWEQPDGYQEHIDWAIDTYHAIKSRGDSHP